MCVVAAVGCCMLGAYLWRQQIATAGTKIKLKLVGKKQAQASSAAHQKSHALVCGQEQGPNSQGTCCCGAARDTAAGAT